MMNVDEVNGWVVCLGYRQFQEGIKGPAEKQKPNQRAGQQVFVSF